ncbi:MAG: response regulator [Chloroflexota bacterium]
MQANPVFLYIEDEPFSRTVMEILMVRGLGYKNLHIFSNSEQFLERIEALAQKPDVIFLDIHLKPYDGFEILALLRQQPAYHSTCVIALTASVMNEEVEMLRHSGFNGAIAKPIDQVAFPGLLQRILGGEEVWNIV